MEFRDFRHSEVRFLRVGPIARGVVLLVWTERYENVVRIISARFASRGERRLWREFVKGIP